MNQLRSALIFFALLSCQATNDPGASPAPAVTNNQDPPACDPKPAGRTGAIKILFVGNSLTYTNDLPDLVGQLGKDNGKLLEVEMLAHPNYALEDHWADGCIQKMIKSGFYDYIVVQQGPSSQADGAQSLLQFGKLIKDLCDANDTKLAFFMVWPARVNIHTFDGVIANYTNAAYTTHSILCPVGYAWKHHIDQTGDYSYYGPDGFHPSQAGSAVAAQIIYDSIFPE